MPKLNIPTVYPIHDNAFVTVPAESWKELCKTINDMTTVINKQSEALVAQQAELDACKSDISKLAKIAEDIYENIE